MTADDRMKCQCASSGMTGQVGGFQNQGVCLQAFPSFLSHPLPVRLLARSLTPVPRSLLLNHTETLATQAKLMVNSELLGLGTFFSIHYIFLIQTTNKKYQKNGYSNSIVQLNNCD